MTSFCSGVVAMPGCTLDIGFQEQGDPSEPCSDFPHRCVSEKRSSGIPASSAVPWPPSPWTRHLGRNFDRLGARSQVSRRCPKWPLVVPPDIEAG